MVDDDVLTQNALEEQERPLHQHLVSELLSIIKEREETESGEELEYPLEADGLIKDALRENATDLHFDPRRDGTLIRMRIDGTVLDGALLTPGQTTRVINQFKTRVKLSPVTRFHPEGGRTSYDLDGDTIDLRLTPGTLPAWRQDQHPALQAPACTI